MFLNLLHNEMTIIQCRKPTLMNEIINIMETSHGYKRYSWKIYCNEVLNNINVTSKLFYNHVLSKTDTGYGPISQTVLRNLIESNFGSPSGVYLLSKSDGNNSTNTRVYNALKYSDDIKYTGSADEFEESLARTLCFGISDINNISTVTRPIAYHELYNCIVTGLRKVFPTTSSLCHYVAEYINTLCGSGAINSSNVANAFRNALDEDDYNTILNTTNGPNLEKYTRLVLFPAISMCFSNAFNFAFDHGVLASTYHKTIENIIFESNNDGVLIEGEYGDYRLFGRVIRVIEACDYNAEYNVMRWHESPDDRDRNYIFDGKIDQYIKSNAERYTRNTFERMRKRLLKIYHNRYTDDELREILFPKINNLPNVLASGKKDYYIPLKYTNEKYGCTKYHIDCDATECPDTEHTHVGSIDCTRCKYMKIRYGELNVYILVNIGVHDDNQANDVDHIRNLKNGIRDIIMYAE